LFFFSSRRRHTRFKCDWSSDVCSSDLIAHDPYVDRDAAASVGAELAGLDDLLRTADFVCICAALTDESRHLIDARRLALMKPTRSEERRVGNEGLCGGGGVWCAVTRHE